MVISGIHTSIVKTPFRKGFSMAMWTSVHKIHVIVEIHTDEGLVGIGESVPLVAEFGEPAEGIKGIIDSYFAPALIGMDPLDLEGIFDKMERTAKGHLFAKSGIDFALHDLIGKVLGVPTYRFLGGQVREAVPLTWVIGITDPSTAREDAMKYVSLGYRTLKLKADKDYARTISALESIRDAIGWDVAIRVDANQAWSVWEAVAAIRYMERFDLELVEQPVHAEDFEGMARVRASVGVPIMIDEGVRTLNDAIRCATMRCADLVNLKIAKMGGIFYSRKIAAIAEGAGLECVVGSMLEGVIGTCAGAHLAVSCPTATHACDLIGPLHRASDVATGGIAYSDGALKIANQPGLGFELNRTAMHEHLLTPEG